MPSQRLKNVLWQIQLPIRRLKFFGSLYYLPDQYVHFDLVTA